MQLDMHTNNVSATIPWVYLGLLSDQLMTIDFFENHVEGTLPSSQVGLMTSLESLDISSNQISGSLPAELVLLETLRYINLDSNFFTGRIGSHLSELTALETLALSNLLTRTILSELGRMTNLRELYLADNFLSGSVPVEMCALGLDKMEVTCELVECSCCSSCSASDIGGGIALYRGNSTGPMDVILASDNKSCKPLARAEFLLVHMVRLLEQQLDVWRLLWTKSFLEEQICRACAPTFRGKLAVWANLMRIRL
jgi:hypothetical protein